MKQNILIQGGEQVEDEVSYGYTCIELPTGGGYVLLRDWSAGAGTSSLLLHDRKVYAGNKHGNVSIPLEQKTLFRGKGHVIKLVPYDSRIISVHNYRTDYSNNSKNWINDATNQELISERPSPVKGLCVFNDRLIDAGHYGLMDTFSGDRLVEGKFDELYVYNNRLYAASGNKVIDVDAGKVVANRQGYIIGFCEHQGDLYDGSADGAVHRTLDDKLIATLPDTILTMCSHNDMLLASVRERIFNVVDNKVLYENCWWWTVALLSIPTQLVTSYMDNLEG